MAASPALPTEDGQFSLGIDDLHFSLQAEQEDTQKKTFTCWINSQLAKHTPPSVIFDLFTDIKKGHVLLDLLEVLSGQQLPRDKGSNTFQCRINIEHALTFLKNRSIKLINIHVADIIEGNPSIILGLIWTIILHFHIEELARTLSSDGNQPPLEVVSVADSSPTSSPPAKKDSRVQAQARWQLSAKKALLQWAQEQCATSESVSVTDFKSSWRNGMAFLAVIHALRPDLIDMNSVRHRSNKDNLKEAFRIAEHELKIPKLLEPEDVDVANPDEKSIMTYVAQFLKYSKDARGARGSAQASVKDAVVWLTLQEKRLQKMQKDSASEPYFNKYNSLLSFMESLNEEKEPYMDVLSLKENTNELSEDQLQLRQGWAGLMYQVAAWEGQLDDALPSPLREAEVWLKDAERLLKERLPVSQDYPEAMTLVQEKMSLFKDLMGSFDYHWNILSAFENRDENHLPVVPPDKLEEMRRRINILARKFIPLLEFYKSKCSVLALLEEAKAKLDVWNVTYGSKESVEVLLRDWHKFIEEKKFLVRLDTSSQKCEEMYKTLEGGYDGIEEDYVALEKNVHACRQHIRNTKSTLQRVLACWTTYEESLPLLKASFEMTKKEQIKEVPFETLSQWNAKYVSLNEVGSFLIEVSNGEVGSSVSKELRRLNKRWRKFLTKTPPELKLPLRRIQDQLTRDSPGKILSKESAVLAEPRESPGENTKAVGKQEVEDEESIRQLEVNEEVEKLIEQGKIWESETKSVLGLLRQQYHVGSSSVDTLQHLIAKGSMYEELLARTEDALQMDVQSASHTESFQNVLRAGLQAKIQEAKEGIQIAMVELSAVVRNFTDESPGLDVRLKVEEAQKELESLVTRAQQLLGRREHPGGLILKYKEALEIFNTNTLAKYLQAVEELKPNVSGDAKLHLEEQSRDACATWEPLHQEISLYIQQLKIDIEERKLRDNIAKLEKQINKEKKLIRRGRTRGLAKEHKACFSPESIACQLEHHMGVLRVLCEELTSLERQQELKKALRDYEQKIERLLKSASEIHTALQSSQGGALKERETLARAENGRRDAHSEAPLVSAKKAMEPIKNFSQTAELKAQQEESVVEKEGKNGSTSVHDLQERYDTQREILERHLRDNKSRITSAFPNENESSSTCLQGKLADLQVLKADTDACWNEFEVTSLSLESLVSDTEKPALAQARDLLKGEEHALQMLLSTRMESLEMALQTVLPLEKECALLCGSDLPFRTVAVQDLQLVEADGVHQNLQDIQDSIAKQIGVCANIEEPSNSAPRRLHTLDQRAVQDIVLRCRLQLETMNQKVEMSGDALQDLEGLLASLRAARLSAKLPADLPASSDAPEDALAAGTIVEDILLVKERAGPLDERLRMLGISLKDAKGVESTTCEKLLGALSVKLPDRHGQSNEEALTEDKKLLEACSSKNNELFKNIQDIQNQISKIGLRDPTAPAVKHRKKSLLRLDKDLDGFEEEKICVQKMASSLPHFEDGREKAVAQQCEDTAALWETTKSSVTEWIEQCDSVLELLKQYQNFKNTLTTLIQKEEGIISQQASYMGKDNLKKKIAEIETVKEEFNEHLEIVDKINQTCKNLQYHLNKMKTFEEPPFEKEANTIVDRWLDMNEKTEEYEENLGRALALWDKLFNLRSSIDEWTEKILGQVESNQLTDEDGERLKEELKVHEEQTSEFSRRVADIQLLLQSNEKPLELQVMESSVLSKVRDVKRHITGESNSYLPSGNTAELKEDLDQAKTQMGVTESLLNALSPSDSLEILTKLEEIQQQIFQQKHSMTILETQIGCLTPELSELKRQYASVSDLFNTKKSALQDHFSTLLNDQCKNFNDWFSNIKMNLKECFEPPETKLSVEQKLQKLADFLTLGGGNSKIQQVETVLQHVKTLQPKAHVKELNSWLESQELELENMESLCQARARELNNSLQQLLRLEDDCRSLTKWLTIQEEKWKEMEASGENTDLFYQVLTRKREQFETVAQLNDSLKEHGLTEGEETIKESTQLIDRYQTLLRQLHEIEEEDKLPPAKDQSFNDLAHDVIHWIKEIKESLMALNSSEGKMPLEERIQKIKEIILLKPEGDAKVQMILRRTELCEAPLVQETLTDISNQWDSTLHLAHTYLSHQEKLVLEGEKYLQSKEDLRLMLTELKKKQEAGFALQPGLPEKQAQLKIYKKFLQKAQDLTSLLEELKSQGNYLLECTKNPSFSEEPWLEVKHLHESLLQQLQDSVQKLEGHVQEHGSYQACITDLNTTLDDVSKEFDSLCDASEDQMLAEDRMQKLQELEGRLHLQGATLKKASALAKSIKRNTSSVGQKIIKDDIKSLKSKQKDLENEIESAKRETGNALNSILTSKGSTEKHVKSSLPGGETLATCDVPEPTQESAAVGESEGGRRTNENSAVEMILSKQLSLNVQESMQNTQDLRKVNELQNQPLELDIMLRNEQLKGMEELYSHLETRKAAIELLEQSQHLNRTEVRALVLPTARSSGYHVGSLLQALLTLKKTKESQYGLLSGFQDQLVAAESSLKTFLAEVEGLKAGSLDSATYLGKIKEFLGSVAKEKGSLSHLQMEWARLSSQLTVMDGKLVESQMKELEHGWELVERLAHRKCFQQATEHSDLTYLLKKAQDMEVSLHQQHQWLLLSLNSSEPQEGSLDMVALAAELQAIEYEFSALKQHAELQMKRLWGEKERKTLEDAINNLKKQLEALEPLNREVENQVRKCDLKNRIKETLSWVKNMSAELIAPIALLPDHILSQIRKCKLIHDGILGKQQAVELLVEEARDITPSLAACESNGLTALLEDLQNQYQALLLKSTQRSQQLELKLEERSKLFAVIGKAQLALEQSETLAVPTREGASTEAELERRRAVLMASRQELRDVESAISAHRQELTDAYQDANVFERLFLDDQLKNLKTRTNRAQRLIQNNCNELDRKIKSYREFREKTAALQKEVESIAQVELLQPPQELKQGARGELWNLKGKLAGIRDGISQVLASEEVFDCIGLSWDGSLPEQLQTQVFEREKKLKEKIKKVDTFLIARDKYQALLSKIRAVDLQVRKRAESLLKAPKMSPESTLLDAQILNQKIEKAKCLHNEIVERLSENEAFDDSFKDSEMLQLKLTAEERGRLQETLQNMLLELQPKEMAEPAFQDKLENSLHILKQIKSRLQQPLCVNLGVQHILDEKETWEALGEQVQAEMCSIRAMRVTEEQREENASGTSGMEAKLQDIENLQEELSKSIDLRTNVLSDAYENVTRYDEVVTRTVGIITSLEAVLSSYRIDLHNPEESLELVRCEQEELQSTVAEIQNLTETLGAISSPEAKEQLQCALQELASKNSALKAGLEAEHERCLENYKRFRKMREQICSRLRKMETDLKQTMSPLPKSYKEALACLEQSKALTSALLSAQEDLVNLRQVLRHLRCRCPESDGACVLGAASALWEKWLSLLDTAREWQQWSGELKRDWKFISEEIEREAIILENLQEELPETSKTKDAAPTEELRQLLDSLCQHEESVEKQQQLLALLLQRIMSIQNVPEGEETVETIPALQEIRSMQEQCNRLLQTAQKSKDSVQTELQTRQSFIKEITDEKRLFEHISTSFQNLALEGHPERAEQSEELQSVLQKGKLTFENIMEKLRIKYSELYSIVPAEIESQVEECRRALEAADEKVSSEVSKSSPSCVMRRKIEGINNGLQCVEKMLQQKSKNIAEAQDIQKKIWDELDHWHSKLNELDSEVQDFVEQDPGQAQEWMDNLMAPFQQHQQVSQRAESRTSQLNKATIKMEEYSDRLKSTQAWIEKTSRLLANPACYDSSRTLSHRASTLQMALEDSDQKHSLLHSIFTDLEDLSIIFETDDLIQSIQELSGQVGALQQQIVEALPHIQQVADDVVAIESEVKSMEKKVAKIKAILLSKEIFDFSPEEHLKHGEVILENIHPMKKTIAEIMSYQVELKLPQTGTKPLPVFQRTNQLLQDVKLLENVTQEQNELLKVVIKQTGECDEEIESLRQILNNYSAEFSPERTSQDQVASLPSLQGEMEGLEKRILNLSQKKEDLLVGLKAAVQNLHEHLKQEQREVEGDKPSAGTSEEGGVAERDASDRKLTRTSSMSFLPVLEEEAEESSVKSEDGQKRAEPPPASWSLPWKHSKDLEEDGASSSSATLVQEADGRISTCDSSMEHITTPDPESTEQSPEPSPRLRQAEEGATPPTEAALLDFPHEQGALEVTVERSRPQPEEILHVCKTQVAELELWLQQANVAFEPETLNADMQQVVEQELAGCQAMLAEIEHKVASLLETCKDQGLGDCEATQHEAETLSWKLKTVKCNLEKVQMMLQERNSEDQHLSTLKKPSELHTVLQPVSLSELESVVAESPQFSRQRDVPQPQILELKPLEQKDLVKFTEFNAKKTWLQRGQQDKDTNQSASSTEVPPAGNAAPDSALPPQGQSGDKWQYLHHELTSRPNSPGPQLMEPQVATNPSILPSVSVYNFRCPTSDELQTYATLLEDLRQEANDLQTQESMTEETYISLDKRFFELFLSLSRCMGSVEELLQRPGLLREDASARQVLLEKLALELKKLYLALGDKKNDLLKAVTWPGKKTILLPECLDALEVSLERTQAKAAWKSVCLKAGLDHSRSFQNEVKRLYNQLIKKKTALQQSLNEISGHSIGEQLQKADVHMAELQNSERQVTKLRSEGERFHFPHALLQDVYKLEDVLDSMWGTLRTRYLELSSPFLSRGQQDALLQGMEELVSIGKEKLAPGLLQHAKSKVALQAQLQDHKGFFQKLVADMLLIQTYWAKMFPSSLQKGERFGAEQMADVRAVEEEACRRGAQLQSLLQKWEEFDENYASLEKDLEVLTSSLPSVSLVEETEERLLERISFYQQIKRNIDGKHARLCQTLNEGKQLAASVSCPELESQITKLEEQWLSLNKKIDHELHRLQTLLKHLLSYSRDSDELTRWLEASQQTLNYWKEQSLNVSQDLDTIRSNIDRFFEFSREVDQKSSLKSAVMSTGNQLLHLKEADTATLRASLAQFEQKWTILITQLPDIQEKLHQLQMEKLPSRKAISEMISWMDAVEPQAAGEDAELSQSSAPQVRNLLQKLKEFRMEMDYKQWIVDFVNQSLLQLSTCDVESKRYERTEFAEHLGEMNRQWHRVHGTLNRKIQHLEQLLESVTENENKIQNLSSWFEAQEERLRMLQKPESAVSMEKLLLDCQDIENQLAVKSKVLDELRQSSLTWEGRDMPLLEDMASGIGELLQKKSHVTSQVHQLRASVQSALQRWKAYDKLYDEANVMTVQLVYSLEHSKPAVLSLEALDRQVQNLQALQDEAESREGRWEKLQEAVGRLKDSCPSVAGIIEEKCQNAHSRWTQVNQDLADQLQEARGQLQLWKASHSAHTEASAQLEQQKAKFQQLANINMSGNNLADILPVALRDIKELRQDVLKTRDAFRENSTLLDQLPQPAERSTPGLHSGQLHSLQTAAYLEKMLLAKSNEFEIVLAQFKDFGDRLAYLKDFIMHEEENLNKLYHEEKEEAEEVPDSFLSHVLALTAQSPDIERLNEESLRLPLGDVTMKTLQNVNRQWIRATATALDHLSKLQESGLSETFLHYCEKWVQLLEKIKAALTVNTAHSLPALLEQQRTYEMLEAEVSINQMLADAYVAQCLQLLDTAEIEKRPEFVSEFSKLSDQWQSAARGVQQRKCDIDRLVTQWQFFTTSVEGLLRFLTDTGHLLSAVKEQERYSLYQTRHLIHELKNKEIHVQRWRTTYELALEAGEELRDTPNLETKEFIDRQAGLLRDTWKDTELNLGEMIRQLQSTAETWDQCEKKIEELKSRLRVLKAQSRDPLPEFHEDLHKEKELIKEVEKSLANWTHNLKELQAMKADLSQHILAEDVTVLKEQIELLHRQWEDLCLRVALRKQEIEDRLNSWIVFNEKNKDLCAWLVQMENKVLQTADISIEEMIEKLQKDCMEEISLFSENKLQLKQMGDQLIKASSKAKAAEVQDKLGKISDRWQHLFDVIGSRVKKLKETFAFIQQLDKNMSNLRTWLARIESELSKPVVYDVCDDQEIQKRLAEQQDLQRDIEQHSAGVESVFNICDVLLHDSDACANETECDSIQQTTRSLDRRWRNICAMSMERRMKIEETWRLWQKFLDDYSRFEDWLKSAERTAACPNSSEVLYTNAKEELKRFEAFQRQIHERLTQLELINKQYRRLARENRTDTASKLKQMVHEGNQRWDNLQRRVTAILRRLRYFTNQREEFEGTRESILVWLTEMDLQLTNVEHFSESDADDKMRQLNGFQQEITLNTNKIDQLIVFGEQLIQKSEPLDAVLIEDELEELHRYCQEVFGRVSRFHRRLTSHAPGLEDEKEASENETDMEDPREIQADSWCKRESEEPASPQSLCHLVPPALGHERSGCETPVSVDSIPLEWDHTGDVGGSSSHEDEEEGPFYSALSDVEIPENPEAYLKMTTKSLRASSGKSISEGHAWHVPDSPSHPKHHYKQMEGDRTVGPVPSDSSTPYKPAYVKLLLHQDTDDGKEGQRGSEDSPQQEDEQLATLTGQQSGAFDRWEVIQEQELHSKRRMKQSVQQLNSDIGNIKAWLEKTEAELGALRLAEPPSSIQEMALRVKRLQEILKAFETYKVLMVSVNVSHKESLPSDSPESTALQKRLHQLSLSWDTVQGMTDNWRGDLRQSLMQCQAFHQLSQDLLLWLAGAESRRQKARVSSPDAERQVLLESQKELMKLEKELVDRQPQVSSLQEISSSLLVKDHGEDYIEAEEKVHVIEKKLKQLLEQVAQDLMALQGSLNPDPSLASFDEVDSGEQPPASAPASYAKQFGGDPSTEEEETDGRMPHLDGPGSQKPRRSFLSRVIRTALPLQLLLLLLLLLACLLPASEDDYSCTQANNFARSFYPMLRYTNGPPPT